MRKPCVVDFLQALDRVDTDGEAITVYLLQKELALLLSQSRKSSRRLKLYEDSATFRIVTEHITGSSLCGLPDESVSFFREGAFAFYYPDAEAVSSEPVYHFPL